MQPVRLTADHAIVIQPDAPQPVTTAATELQSHIKQITGLSLPVRLSGLACDRSMIVIGLSGCVSGVPLSEDVALLPEEYLIQSRDQALCIRGGSPRGTLYGAYGLLRDHFGCRWFAPGCASTPSQPDIVIAPFSERNVPAFEYRNFILNEVADHPQWGARNAFNGINSGVDAAHGGCKTHWHYGHSLHALLPVASHFREHPEYFDSASRSKAIIDDHVNLCYTNDRVVQIVSDNMCRAIEAALAAEQADPATPCPDMFYLAQSDGGAPCRCPGCQRMIDSEGALSAPLIHFCNRVVENVDARFPGHPLMTIAYRFSRRPPRSLQAHPKLIVQLCSIECCQSHLFDRCDDPDNPLFVEDIEKWRTLVQRLYIWDYQPRLWHTSLAGPGVGLVAEKLRWFHERGVRGIFHQTAGEPDFKWLRAWVMCQCMRDPYGDWRLARDSFMRAYYGAAAESLQRYIDAIDQSISLGNHHLHYKAGTVQPFFSAQVMDIGAGAFADASEAVAGDDTLVKRVEEESMHFLASRLQHQCRDSVLHHCGIRKGRYVFGRDANMQSDAARFAAWRDTRFASRAATAGEFSGAGGVACSCEYYLESDDVVFRTPHMEMTFLPRLAGRLVTWRLLPSGWDLMPLAMGQDGCFDQEQGYVERWLSAPGSGVDETTSSWRFIKAGIAGAGAAEGGAEHTVADAAAGEHYLFETGGIFRLPMQWERWTRVSNTRPAFNIESQTVNRGITTEDSAVETCLPLNLGSMESLLVNGKSIAANTDEVSLTARELAAGIVIGCPEREIAITLHVIGNVVESAQIRRFGDSGHVCFAVRTASLPLGPGAGVRFCQNFVLAPFGT